MKQIHFSLSKAYLFAFSILAMWATFAFFTMGSLIDAQELYAKLINLSGKQRMLSQKTALYSSRHLIAGDPAYLRHFDELKELMKEEHAFITSHLTSEKMEAFYFGEDGLDAKVQDYFHRLDAFSSSHSAKDLDALLDTSADLLGELNKAVYAFEEESELKVKGLKRRELFIYIGTLLTLMLEGIFIVRPVTRLIDDYTKTLEEEVKKRTNRLMLFAKIFEHSQEGMLITDSDEKILDVNKAFTTITGFKRDETIGQTPRILRSSRHDQAFYKQMWEAIETKGIWQGEIINKNSAGDDVHEDLTIMKIIDEEHINYVSVFSDITDRLKDEARFRYLATHDTLTGLPNRTELIDRIEHALKLTGRIGKKLAIIFIDLDNFKLINDSMGHAVGDEYLIKVADRLNRVIRDTDTLGRLGGDEFVILLESIDSESALEPLMQKMMRRLNEPLSIMDRDFFPTASFGVVLFPYGEASETNAKALIRKADLAMYQAKGTGKNQIAYYSARLDEKIQSYLLVETRLRDAIASNALELFLQPKVHLSDMHVIGAEALLRWNDAGRYISPDEFLPVAEESDQIKDIDLWVCREGVRIAEAWHAAGHGDLRLSLNISGRTFSNIKAMQEYVAIVARSSVAASIDIEITENALVGNLTIASKIIDQIKRHGLTVTLDDFGTGYSSFAYLSRLPFDAMKIDRSFIKGMKYEKQRILVDAMLSFSNRLGMQVIAEGIEEPEQLDWLIRHRCDVGQGYHFSRPMPSDDFLGYLRSTKT